MTDFIKPALATTFVWLFCSSNASAELYKCTMKGLPTYQSQPCAQSQTESLLSIKERTPEQEALALEKLQAVRNQYASEKIQRQQEMQRQNPAK